MRNNARTMQLQPFKLCVALVVATVLCKSSLAFCPSSSLLINNELSVLDTTTWPRDYYHDRIVTRRETQATTTTSLFLAKKNKKNLSMSEKEQRDEEERRKARQDDVVIGKTSAKRNAQDYQLDVKSTEAEFFRQASSLEQEVYKLTETGLEYLKMYQLEEADHAFSKVFELRPNAYLWQAGIVKFYLGDYKGASEIFANSAVTYETKFGSPASEERIWHHACNLMIWKSLSKTKRRQLKEEHGKNAAIVSLIPRIPDVEMDDMFQTESRKVLRLTRDLFGASLCNDISQEVLARAQLRSIGAPNEDIDGPNKGLLDRKLRRLTSWFFLGIHYDCIENKKESAKCMKMALKLCPNSGKSEDIIHTLPMLHMSRRDWFDDDDFDTNPVEATASSSNTTNKDSDNDKHNKEPPIIPSPPNPSFSVSSMAYADPVIEEAIWEGVTNMKRTQLVDALRLRGLKMVGDKEALRERLFYSLMDDSGFSSGFAP